MRKAYDWGKVRLAMLSVVAAAFMFLTVSLECFAAEGTVTAASAKIRESASTSSAHVGSAANGDKLTITGQESGADGYTWYKVTFDGTKSGYIRADLMSVAGDVPAEQAATYNPTVAVTELTPVSATVTGSSVRVRPDAKASGGVVTSVVKDTVLTVDGMATGSDGKVWYRVNCTVSGATVLGFVREDFISLQGDVSAPSEEVTPSDPVVPDSPSEEVTPSEPVATEAPKEYETVYENDKWYLLNNEANEKYVISDLFSAVNTNRDLAEKYEKTAKSQKGFIWLLSILLILAVAAVAFLVWKLKDMLDEAYFKQVEKKTLRDRENSPKRVMHTVGEERKQGGQQQKRPAQGQAQRPAQGQQARSGQRPAGEGVRKPAGQTRPNGEAPKKPVNRPGGTQAQERPVQQRPAQESAKPQAPATSTASAPSQPQKAPSAGVQQPQQKKPESAKPQGWQAKNFMTDDDEFEFEFLNWDGEEDM